jgi:hypothetical protein
MLSPEAAAFITSSQPAATSAPVAPTAAQEEARVRFTVDLPKSLHKRLKQAAMDRDEPMTDLARNALAEWLSSQA